MDNFKENLKAVLKRIRRGIPVLLVGSIIVTLLAGFTYFITVDDGLYKRTMIGVARHMLLQLLPIVQQ